MYTEICARCIDVRQVSDGTQEEIAEREGMAHQSVALILQEFPELGILAKSVQTLATYSEPDWTVPIYNVWKQQKKSSFFMLLFVVQV